jgi:hypothetical protein
VILTERCDRNAFYAEDGGNRKTVGIRVPLELADFEVTASEVVNGVPGSRWCLPDAPLATHCGSVSVTGHGTNVRRIRDRACAFPDRAGVRTGR